MTGIEVITTTANEPNALWAVLLPALLLATVFTAIAFPWGDSEHFPVWGSTLIGLIFVFGLGGATVADFRYLDGYGNSVEQAQLDTITQLEDHYDLDLGRPGEDIDTLRDGLTSIAATDRPTGSPVAVIVKVDDGRITVYGDAGGTPAAEYRTNTAK